MTEDMRAMDFAGSEYVDVMEFNTAYRALGKGFSGVESKQIVEGLIKEGKLNPILSDEK